MKQVLFISLAFIIFSSCEKDKNESKFDGSYKGTFERYKRGTSIQQSEVTLNLAYPNWTGSSSIPKFPALNTGRFSEGEDFLKFTNTSPWTADFDWTLILDGGYISHSTAADSLVLTKSYGNGAVDVYRLKKQ